MKRRSTLLAIGLALLAIAAVLIFVVPFVQQVRWMKASPIGLAPGESATYMAITLWSKVGGVLLGIVGTFVLLLRGTSIQKKTGVNDLLESGDNGSDMEKDGITSTPDRPSDWS